LEVARSVGNLSCSSLGLLLHAWWFSRVLGLERKMCYELKMETRKRDTIGV